MCGGAQMSVEGTWWSGEGAQMNVDGHGEGVGGMEGVPRLCRVLQRSVQKVHRGAWRVCREGTEEALMVGCSSNH